MNDLERRKSNYLRRQLGIFTPQEIEEARRAEEVRRLNEALEAAKGMPLFND